MIVPMPTSSMPPVQTGAQQQAIGTTYPLTLQEMWEATLPLPSIPTTLFIFLTMLAPMPTSSMPPVQVVAQPQAIGTLTRFILQEMWDITPQSPSVLTILSISPSGMTAIPISITPPAQVVVHPLAIGVATPLTQQEMWGCTLPSLLIPKVLSTFPTGITRMTISSTQPAPLLAIRERVGAMSLLTQPVQSVGKLQLPLIPTMLFTFPTMIILMKISSISASILPRIFSGIR